MSKKINTSIDEKMLNDISRFIESKNPKNKADLESIINSIMKYEGRIPKQRSSAACAKEKAEDIIYRAFETSTKAKRIKLAKEALAIYPDCADAYLIIAEHETTAESAYPILCKAVEAGRRDLGEKVFNETKGHFWGYTETRPFMRAMAALANCLSAMGKYDEAIKIAKEMLELNPGDNQGMRYRLLTIYGLAQKYTEMEELLNQKDFEDDVLADWAYGHVLISYIKHGDCKLTEKAIDEAMRVNKHIPECLVCYEDISKQMPVAYSLGSKEEAINYALLNAEVWIRAPQAFKNLVTYTSKNISKWN